MFSQASAILFMGGGCVSQHALGKTPPRKIPPVQIPPADPLGRPPPPTATAADGTHPSGMHSCTVNVSQKQEKHSSRMRTAHLPIVRAFLGATWSQYQ